MGTLSKTLSGVGKPLSSLDIFCICIGPIFLRINSSHSVVVSTPDFESGVVGSNPSGSNFYPQQYFFFDVCRTNLTLWELLIRRKIGPIHMQKTSKLNSGLPTPLRVLERVPKWKTLQNYSSENQNVQGYDITDFLKH